MKKPNPSGRTILLREAGGRAQSEPTCPACGRRVGSATGYSMTAQCCPTCAPPLDPGRPISEHRSPRPYRSGIPLSHGKFSAEQIAAWQRECRRRMGEAPPDERCVKCGLMTSGRQDGEAVCGRCQGEVDAAR